MTMILTDEDVAAKVSTMTALAVAIFASEHHIRLETVQASPALHLPERLGFKTHPGIFEVTGAVFAYGVPDMEALICMPEGKGEPMVAVRVFRVGLHKDWPSFWVYTVEEYIRWLAGNDGHSVNQAIHELTKLLPNSHPLKAEMMGRRA